MSNITCYNCNSSYDDGFLSCPSCGASKHRQVATLVEAAVAVAPAGISQRNSRTVEQLLQQAETASGRGDWVAVQGFATSALNFDAGNADARAYLADATRNLGAITMPVLGPARIVALALLSNGFYILYWSYLSWKQLRSETGEEHYPVWHALTFFVPIYGLFRMHKHLDVIEETALRANLTSLTPAGGVLLLIAGNVLSGVTVATPDTGLLLALYLVSTVLYGVVVFLGQTALTKIWRQRGHKLREAGLSWVELAVVAFGVLTWAPSFVPAS